MDPNNGKDSGNSRRSSTRRSRSLRLSTGSGADDDYDLSAMMVADGFRPNENATSSSTNPTSNSNTQPESSLSSTESFSQQTTSTKSSQTPLVPSASDEITPAIRNRPSSISKPHRNHDSLALRNDGTSTADRSHARNNHSLSSDSPVIRAESPYTGPSGPSHPYQMYPQRTMSVATTSTTANAAIPEDRSYGGPQGPTHPYALYTQNTTSAEVSTPSIPVGFNGLGGSYQRQLGPDGEEAGDLVGPLGHTEELPPYTRYPDNAYVPKPTTQTPQSPSPVSPVSEPSSPSREIPGAGGIGMATRDPEFSSTDDDLALPRTRPSVRSNVSEASQHDINTAAAEISEKPPVNKWQRRAKKKLWGIVPYWAICLLLVGLILMGIIMGAVIGTVLTKNNHNNNNNDTDSDDKYVYQPPSATTYDPIVLTAIPPGLPTMPTGLYALPNPVTDPTKSNDCFNDTTQQPAWSCDIVIPVWSIQIDGGINPKSKNPYNCTYNLTLKAIPDKNTPFPWGTQAPSILQPVPLILVNETQDTARGPAWWLRAQYNKSVIVSESTFSSELGKRGPPGNNDEYEDYNSFHRFKSKPSHAVSGQKPWFCTWPNTLLEFFIYPNETTTWPKVSSSYEEYTTTSGYPPAPTPGDDKGWGDVKKPKVFPRAYKMVERRLLWNEESVATCTQYEIYGDGTKKRPVVNTAGEPVMIEIVEKEEQVVPIDKWVLKPTKRSEAETKQALRSLLRRTNPSNTDCGCIWTPQ
ncbi:glucan 4-alpha-glucosidase [Fusarium austroafricanum]|uniref:Glucan 4-alpha-glucosidase n=1 Tax=Fusarium austroafricanum TaxID=2364996 RepID=A0A8H4KBU4_9HYPO|nr:glucan 4-alpha-glucosidase [Fusarium austroafricanum]